MCCSAAQALIQAKEAHLGCRLWESHSTLLAALRVVAGRLLSNIPLACGNNVVIAGATAESSAVLQHAGWTMVE